MTTPDNSATPAEPASGVELIGLERQRQIGVEGWAREHDEMQLTAAAACYLKAADATGNAQVRSISVRRLIERRGLKPDADPYYRRMLDDPISHTFGDAPPERWPWDESWWKPSNDSIRNLVKAGALIAAEIDRLHRKQRDDRAS